MGQFLTAAVNGAVIGSLFALLAFGIVITYRTTGIFNFAQGALAMLFAFLFFQLIQGGRLHFVFVVWDVTTVVPTWLALVLVVLVIAPLFGWALDRIMFRRLRSTETHVQIVSTIGLLIALQGLVALVWGGQPSLQTKEIFPTDRIGLGFGAGTSVSFLLTIAATLALTFVLMAFLRYTRLGVHMRAVVDRIDLAELMGVNSQRVSALAWGGSAALAALAGILVAPIQGAALEPQTLPLLLILPAVAAAVVGRIESLPLTLAGGVAIGAGQALSQTYGGGTFGPVLQASLPFIVLFGALLLPIDWREVRPDVTRREAASPVTGRLTRRRTIGYTVAAAVIVLLPNPWLDFPPFDFFAEHQIEFATIPAIGLVFLGLVMLVGYAGQISIAHGAFAAVGAITAAHLVADASLPFLVAALAGGLVAMVPGVVIAFRAVRLSPLFLGLMTLAFAALVTELMTNVEWLTNRGLGVYFDRTAIFDSPYSYYVGGLVVFLAASLILRNLRIGSVGLALNAMRDSETAIAGFGSSLARLKTLVFALSAFLAGVGGAFLAGGIGRAEPLSFQTPFSLIFLALAVVGGIRYARGALIGAGLLVLSPILLQRFSGFLGRNSPVDLLNFDALPTVGFGVAAILLANNPGGIVEQSSEGWLRTFGEPPSEPPGPATSPPTPADETTVLETAGS